MSEGRLRTWIDTHIHVSDIGPDGTVRDEMVRDLLDVLDTSGSDLRFVVSPDGPYFSRMMQDPAGIMEANSMIRGLVSRAPGRLYGACMVNPGFLDASLRAMETCFGEWGYVMLGEMLQYMMGYRMDSDEVEPLLRQAEQFGVPVQVHLGTYWFRDDTGSSTAGMEQIGDLLRAAERVPGADYILAHAIGVGPTPAYVPWAGMFLDTLAGLFSEYPDNFYVEIRDFHAPALQRTLAEVPSTHLLAGTDWTTRVGPPFQPYGTVFDTPASENPFPPSVASFVQFLRDAGADEQTVVNVGSENARALFGIK